MPMTGGALVLMTFQYGAESDDDAAEPSESTRNVVLMCGGNRS
jgi:hypothetical protein